MSQITVENIKRSSETAARSTRGVAAAWCSMTISAGTPTIVDSLNTASLVDSAAGTTRYNLSSSFAAAEYAKTGVNTSVNTRGVRMLSTSASQASSVVESSGDDDVDVTAFGDLA